MKLMLGMHNIFLWFIMSDMEYTSKYQTLQLGPYLLQ